MFDTILLLLVCLGVPLTSFGSGFSGFRYHFIATQQLRAPTIPNTKNYTIHHFKFFITYRDKYPILFNLPSFSRRSLFNSKESLNSVPIIFKTESTSLS